MAQNAFYQGDYQRADEFQQRALHLDRANPWGNIFYPTAALYQDRLDEAEKRIRAAREVLPKDAWLTSCEGMLWAKRGEFARAERLLRRALHGGQTMLHTHHMWHTSAATYALMSKPGAALTWLRRAARLGLPNHPAFRDDHHFRGMQQNTAFHRLLRETKKEWTAYKKEFGRSRAE